MSNKDKYVARDECVTSRNEVITLVTNIHDDVKKHGMALYGSNGRGGIQHDVTKILTVLENGDIKSSLKVSDKIVVALITVVGSIIVAVVANGVI